MTDKKWLYDYYKSQCTDAHRMYGGTGFREYKQIRRLDVIRRFVLTGLKRGGCLLDVGCGDGHAAKFLLKGQDVKYLGVDLSFSKLKKCCESNGWVAVADVETLPVVSSGVDFVICLETLEHLLNPIDALNEIGRVLKKNGGYVLSVPINSRLQPWFRKIRNIGRQRLPVFDEHIHVFTVKWLKKALERAGLTVLDIEYAAFHLPLFSGGYRMVDYDSFYKLDRLLSKIPLCFLGAGVHGGISFGIGNEYIIVAGSKT
ncbi:MAG: class I SAM-dependent methyltransferase [Nitrospirae bacterium]|nr:class I SAM-dependent methyltransferase [Nitrospirota bacterium]